MNEPSSFVVKNLILSCFRQDKEREALVKHVKHFECK
mgnify:CR=1 FL=1